MLAALLLHPEAALHGRELARITGASPGSLHRELRALTGIDLLLRQETGRKVVGQNRCIPTYCAM